jgi:PhzF family phenazine biosynthesis protein
MTLKIYQVDAFTDHIFGGNPASVCPLDEWISDSLMQRIALENNQAETVFYVKKGKAFEIRWFTPSVEVDLCGHATLAAAHVLFVHDDYKGPTINFVSHKSGPLSVDRADGLLTLNFPADIIEEVPVSSKLYAGLSKKPVEAFKGKTDYMLVYEHQSDIEKMIPDFARIATLHECRGLIITAPGEASDFVSRFFAPQSGINEDPVTGSAHTSLTPYWSKRLGKSKLTAIQLSGRRGDVWCEMSNDRVLISGNAKTYMTGNISFDDDISK